MSKKKDKPFLDSRDLAALIQSLESGVLKRQHLHGLWQNVGEAVREARNEGLIGAAENLLFDPARLDKDSAQAIAANNGNTTQLPDFALRMRETLVQADVPALSEEDFQARLGGYFGVHLVEEAELDDAGVLKLTLRLFQPYHEWYYLAQTSYEVAYEYALREAEIRSENAWRAMLEWAGNELRIGAKPGDTIQTQALSRMYTRNQADEMLGLPKRVFRQILGGELLPMRRCPDGGQRVRAADVHRLRQNPALMQAIEDELDVTIWQVRTLTGLSHSYLKTYLYNAGIPGEIEARPNGRQGGTVWYKWGDVRKVFWPEGDHPLMIDIDIIEQTEGAGSEAWWSQKIIDLHEEIEEKRRQQREAKQRRREERFKKRDELRAQMINNFPSWLREEEIEQIAYIHVGPTNSGKTHDALQELANAGSGWYLAPLRLLAREMFERLNKMGAYCSLLTGEERIDVPGATITAATVEMFNPARSGECVVIDEAHMVGDESRGWAWTQALVQAQAPVLHVITAPHGLSLLTRIFESTGIETQILNHQRLVPLDVAPHPWPLDKLPPRTILIAFSRKDVLRLKYTLQNRYGRSVSVVYGALPPEVRLKQAQRFAEQEVDICVATDAVGMGLNLPADNVVFSTLAKFDGKQMRNLYPGELQQIAGRAGRFGLSEGGFVAGVDRQIHSRIQKMLNAPVPDVKVARLAPRTDEIELLSGDLAQRLITWQQLNAVPDELRDILTSTDMADRIDLARLLSYKDLTKLGVEKALTLVNAPVRNESQEYWVECATAVLEDTPLPPPPHSPASIDEGHSLKMAEMVIACIDVYLWLTNRQPFQHLVSDPYPVIMQRDALTREMDIALMKKFNPNSSSRNFRGDDYWDDYL